MHLLSGQNIDRYHIIEPLGEGGMAVVYKAFDTRLNYNVALKIIRTEKISPESAPSVRKRFENEARKTARLVHPNIVPVVDYGDYEGVPYLVMKFIAGGTLKQLATRPLPYKEAIQLLLPIAYALEYAHKNGIIHRDVKPANILITETGVPMLSDFGVAKILETSEETLDHLTVTGVGIGTPEYMSPEQASGKHIDARTDVYALGIVLYELITGRKPFVADTPLAVAIKQTTDPLPRPSQFVHDIPEEVEHILYKALAKKPEDRFKDMGEFASQLRNILENKPIAISAALTQPQPGETKENADRNSHGKPSKWIWGLIPLIVLSVMAAIYFTNLNGEKNSTPAAATDPAVESTGQTEVAESPVLTLAPTSIPELDQSAMYANTNLGPVVEGALMRLGKGSVNDIAMTTDGKEIIVATSLGLYFYDTTTLELNRYYMSDTPILFIAIQPGGDFLALAAPDTGIEIIDLANFETQQVIDLEEDDTVGQIAFTSTGKKLIGAGGGKIIVWDTSDWSRTQELGNLKCIMGIVTFPEKEVFASSFLDNSIIVWNAENGEKIKELSVDKTIIFEDESGYYCDSTSNSWSTWSTILPIVTSGLGLSPDGKKFSLASGGSINIWDTTTWGELNNYSMYESVTYSPDNRFTTLEHYQRLEIIENSTGKVISTIPKNYYSTPNAGVNYDDYIDYSRLIFTPDSTYLFGLAGETIIRWDLTQNNSASEIIGHAALKNPAFSQTDSMELFTLSDINFNSSGQESSFLNKWDLGKGMSISSFQNPVNIRQVSSFTIPKNGNTIVGMGGKYFFENPGILLWDSAAGNYLRALQGSGESISTITYSNKGDLIAGGDMTGKIILWDIATRTIKQTFETQNAQIDTLVFSGDDQFLASTTKNTLRIWDLSNLSESLSFGISNTVSRSVFSPDNTKLIFGDVKGKINIWNTETWEKENTIEENDSGVCGLDVSPDAKYLAAGFCNGEIKIFNLETLAPWKSFIDPNGISELDYSPDGSLLATQSAGDTVLIWQLDESVPFGKNGTGNNGVDATAEINDPAALPDLVANSLSLSNDNGFGSVGDKWVAYFTLCVNMRNAGVGTSPASELVVSTNGFSSVPVAIPMLASGESYQHCDLLSKTYDKVIDFCQPVSFKVDWQNSVKEASETNNSYSGEICHQPK